MKLPIKLLKCQTKDCEQKATEFYLNHIGWFCDRHYRENEKDVQRTMDWIREQEDRLVE